MGWGFHFLEQWAPGTLFLLIVSARNDLVFFFFVKMTIIFYDKWRHNMATRVANKRFQLLWMNVHGYADGVCKKVFVGFFFFLSSLNSKTLRDTIKSISCISKANFDTYFDKILMRHSMIHWASKARCLRYREVQNRPRSWIYTNHQQHFGHLEDR